MDKITEFQDIISELIADQQFLKEPVELYAPIDYIMSQGGKRLRPVLTLLVNNLFDGKLENVIYPALAIEIFHSFTLVHDDIMDKAPMRRGMPTIYKKWNADIAILSGDTMFAMAYQYALQTDTSIIPAILEVFSRTAIEVCEGQQYDMNFENEDDVSIDDYLEMIRLKTAVLMGTSAKIGAITAGASAEAIDSLYNFGMQLGLAFQLKDDLLDTYGEFEQFGKVRGGDIASNKKTFLFLKALEKGSVEEKNRLNILFSSTDTLPLEEKIKEVIDIYNKLDIEAEVTNLMARYFEKSLHYLEQLKVPKEKKEDLYRFAHQLYQRNY